MVSEHKGAHEYHRNHANGRTSSTYVISKPKKQKKVKLPLSGKRAIQLKKKIDRYDNLENNYAKLQEKNDEYIGQLAKKLNHYKEDQYNSKSYRKTARQYDQALKRKEELQKKDDEAFRRFTKANSEYHRGLSANYHIKARQLNNRIIDLQIEQEKLHERDKVTDMGRWNQNHFGHSKRYGELADEIDKLKAKKQKMTFASESHHKLSAFNIPKSTWRQLAQK